LYSLCEVVVKDWPILIKIVLFRWYFVKFSNTKFNQIQFIRFRVVSCVRMDGGILIGSLQSFERA
jgi:hypothetical protein